MNCKDEDVYSERLSVLKCMKANLLPGRSGMQNAEHHRVHMVMAKLFQSQYSYQAYACGSPWEGRKKGKGTMDTSADSLEQLFGKVVFPAAPLPIKSS